MEHRASLIPVFLNSRAGLSNVAVRELRQRLGADLVDVIAVDAAALPVAVEAAAAAGTPIIGVAGGDGTLHSAANVLAGRDSALACVPTGTLNNFARRIGIDSLETAAAALRTPHIRTIAVGMVQERVFLNTLTLGEYARIVRMREKLRRFVGKWPGALVAFIVTLTTLRRLTVTLLLDEEQLVRRTPFVWLGIGWGSFPRVHEAAERRARPDLEVAVVRAGSKPSSMRFVARIAAGMISGKTPLRDRDLEIMHARSLVLTASHRIDATADGEVLRLHPPVDVHIRDNALRVLVGPSQHEHGSAV